MNSTSSKTKSVIGVKKIWKFKLDYMILVDEDYYVISGADRKAMDFPWEIKYNYIRLRNPEQNLQRVNEKEMQKF